VVSSVVIPVVLTTTHPTPHTTTHHQHQHETSTTIVDWSGLVWRVVCITRPPHHTTPAPTTTTTTLLSERGVQQKTNTKINTLSEAEYTSSHQTLQTTTLWPRHTTHTYIHTHAHTHTTHTYIHKTPAIHVHEVCSGPPPFMWRSGPRICFQVF
jgi:hypothetical protein